MQTTYCFTQTTYPKLVNDSLIVITPSQLKATNLIFLEHKKLELESRELKAQIESYDNLLSLYLAKDSLRVKQINELSDFNKQSVETIKNQNLEIDKLTRKNLIYKGISIGGVTITASLLLILILK